MATTVTITIVAGAAPAAAIDTTSATRIARDAALEVAKAIGRFDGACTSTVTVS